MVKDLPLHAQSLIALERPLLSQAGVSRGRTVLACSLNGPDGYWFVQTDQYEGADQSESIWPILEALTENTGKSEDLESRDRWSNRDRDGEGVWTP